jgi:hypothetical protein
MPLDAFEIRILAEFARFVDKENIARVRIKNALTLDEVVLVAHFYGFSDISARLFIKATNLLISTNWIWKKYGKKMERSYFHVVPNDAHSIARFARRERQNCWSSTKIRMTLLTQKTRQ